MGVGCMPWRELVVTPTTLLILASMAEIIKSLGMATELLKREKLLAGTLPLTGTMLMPFLSMILLDMTIITKIMGWESDWLCFYFMFSVILLFIMKINYESQK